MKYGENLKFSSFFKNRIYNYISLNFDILDLWRLWKSSIVGLIVQDEILYFMSIWNGICDRNLIKKNVNIYLKIPYAGLIIHTRGTSYSRWGYRTPGWHPT